MFLKLLVIFTEHIYSDLAGEKNTVPQSLPTPNMKHWKFA